MEATLVILFAALVADWYLGEPRALWSKIGHPVEWLGRLIELADKKLNREAHSEAKRYRFGAGTIVILVIGTILLGLAMQRLFGLLGPLGWLAEGFVVFTLIAQHSLREHVAAVADGLRKTGLEGGRTAVARIVGREPHALDRSSVCRAAIESLAENLCDGVVAPAFWYAIFGLPGILAYKTINTADSMIGYRNDRYRSFGRVAAQIDDLANWLPARLSAVLIAAGALAAGGSAGRALGSAAADAGLHRSPNAGWPEAAMAGAAGIALGGPRIYAGETVQQAFLNGAGKRRLGVSDIDRCIGIFTIACFVQMALVLLFALVL